MLTSLQLLLQASLSQVSSLSGAVGVNLLHELVGVLRRALNQQATVREALYKGLLQVVSMAWMLEHVFNISFVVVVAVLCCAALRCGMTSNCAAQSRVCLDMRPTCRSLFQPF